MSDSMQSRNAILAARIGLGAGGALWALGGLFLYWVCAPTKQEDGTYWYMIDPISAERASALGRQAMTGLAIGFAGAAVHVAAMTVSSKPWSRWIMLAIGCLYGIAAILFSVEAVHDSSSAFPAYAAIAAVI